MSNSTSKQMYSFGKCPRNLNSKKSTCDSYYEVQEKIIDKNKGTSFGKLASTKKLKQLPGPQDYMIKSDFGTKGISFGISGNHYKKVYNQANPPTKGWTDPGLYNSDGIAEEIIKSKKRMFFGRRERLSGEDPHKLSFPGPGQYDAHLKDQITQSG